MKNVFTNMLFIVLSLLLVCTSFTMSANASEYNNKNESDSHDYADDNDTWTICFQQGRRDRHFYQYDATDENLYFSYSDYNCVDVYDKSGKFVYSFIFPDRQNGCISVRCDDDRVYIGTKDEAVYIFDGTTEIAYYQYEEAVKLGYDFGWFEDNQPRITVDEQWIHWQHGASGKDVRLATPSVISNTVPHMGISMVLTLLLAFLAAFLVILFYFVIKSKYSRQ